MARGWHYTKLFLSSALLLPFSGMCCVLLFLLFVYFVLFIFMVSLKQVDISLIFSCPAGHVLDWQPRIFLCLAEARSVKFEEHTHTHN